MNIDTNIVNVLGSVILFPALSLSISSVIGAGGIEKEKQTTIFYATLFIALDIMKVHWRYCELILGKFSIFGSWRTFVDFI